MLYLADAIVIMHLAFIGLVICGALFTRGRPLWTGLHIAALCWGVVVEIGPWPCPLTVAEQACEWRAGYVPFHGSFLLHTLDAVLYPNLPWALVGGVGVLVCLLNLGVYARRWWQYAHRAR